MATTPLDTTIVEVTVYPDRARITRSGTVQLTPGEHELVLGDLPAALQSDSVRASGRGANVRILGVDVQTQFITGPSDANGAALQQQLQTVQDADTALADEEAGLTARADFLKTLRQEGASRLARGLAEGQATIESVDALVQYLTRELAAVQARKRAVAAQRRDLALQITALQNQMAPRPDSLERRQIVVGVEASAATSLALDVLYGVSGAGWAPLYDVRLVGETVTVTYLANVRQQTGEDWPATQLVLSTARPAVTTTIPELDPWYVDVYRPLPPRGPAAARPMQAASGAGAAPSDDYAAADAVPKERRKEAPAEIAQATVESAGAAVTYRVARPVAVPSDGTPHKTTVTTLDLPAQLDYLTVPKLAEEAYLRATIKNTTPFIFLPGPANIFHGADFVGTTRLDTVVPNEEFEAQLGVDDRVKVERKLAGRTSARASLLGNHTRNEWDYTITLTNHRDTPARVTVQDQVPVSRQDDIKVKLTEATPPPQEQTDLNVLKWVLTLAPQSTQTLSFAFSVEYPRNLTVTGLPQ